MPLGYPQPALTSDAGVILTVGFLGNADRFECVVPLATDGDPPNLEITICRRACEAFALTILPQWLGILGNNVSCIFIQGEGMVDGRVPFRTDFIPGDEPGTLGADALHSSGAALGVYYVDPSQTLSTGRMRVAKNFFAGIPVAHVVGDLIDATLQPLLAALIDNLAQGFADTDSPVSNWYRVGKAVRQTGQALPNIVATAAREYIAVQRRRQLPR